MPKRYQPRRMQKRRGVPLDFIIATSAALAICITAVFINTRIALHSGRQPNSTSQAAALQFLHIPAPPVKAIATEHLRPSPDHTQQDEPEIQAPPAPISDKIPLSGNLQISLYNAAQEFDVDYTIALSVIEQETRFQNLIGDNGNGFGYFQIQPKWWSWLMEQIGVTDLMDPAQNFRAGCASSFHKYLTLFQKS